MLRCLTIRCLVARHPDDGDAGTVQSVSFSTYRRNTIRLDRPLPLRLLPEWGRITAAGQEPAGEKTRSITHLILLANMAR